MLVDVQGTAVNVMYKYLWQWVDGRTAFTINISLLPNELITVPVMDTSSPWIVKKPLKLT